MGRWRSSGRNLFICCLARLTSISSFLTRPPHGEGRPFKAGGAGSEFISTEGEGRERVIKLHQDGGGGRPLGRRAVDLPRTILSATNAAESPTACLVRREMRSWQLLQLEPSALRRPDEFNAPTKLGPDGAHLPATLFWLASHNGAKGKEEEGAAWRARIYAQVADRLSELIEDVYGIVVDRDEKRELLTVFVTGRDQTPHAARSLSDGTLRFLALAVLVQDPHTQGVLCLEEPENGIHPARIPAMIRLLQDLATDPDEAVGPDNPLRQVIVNTHSPAVVLLVPDDSLLVAEQREIAVPSLGGCVRGVTFSYLPETWRAAKSPEPLSLCPKGKLLDYLNPVAGKAWDDKESIAPGLHRAKRSRAWLTVKTSSLSFPTRMFAHERAAIYPALRRGFRSSVDPDSDLPIEATPPCLGHSARMG